MTQATGNPGVQRLTILSQGYVEHLVVTAGTYTHTQDSANSTWTVEHGLGFFPSITVVDSAGTEVEGAVVHTDENEAVITFSAAFSGKAYCS